MKSHATAEYVTEMVQVSRPKLSRVDHSMVIETVEVNTTAPAPILTRQSGAVEATVDGASHPILSLGKKKIIMVNKARVESFNIFLS